MTAEGRSRLGQQPAADSTGQPGSTTKEAVEKVMRGLFGRDSLYMVLWVAQLAAAALVTPVATRVLGIGEYGTVAVATALMQVLFIVAGCGLQLAIQRRFADPGGLTAGRGLLTVSILIATALTAAAVATGPLWISGLGFGSFAGPVRLAVLWAGTSAVTAACLALLRSQDRLAAFGSVSLIQSVVAEMTAVGLAAGVSPSAEMFIAGQLIAQTAAAVLGIGLARPRPLRKGDLALARSGLAFAVPLVPAMLGSLLLEAVDRFMVNAHLGHDATARYQIAYNVGSLPILVVAALDSAWLPRLFAVRDRAHRTTVLAASRDALYRLLAPVLVGFSLVSPLLLRLWAPPDFRTGGLLLVTAIIVVSALPYAAGRAARRGLLVGWSTAGIAVATVVAAAFNIGLNRMWIPAYGLTGAALATFTAYGLQYLILWVWSPRGRRRLRPSAGLVQATAAAAVAVAGVTLPITAAGMAVRLVLGTGCLVWLVVALDRVAPMPGRRRVRAWGRRLARMVRTRLAAR